ncbi:MAG TPA: TetR/AcrR family transcriptional regulator C-terminal domain-containing protein [Acidimicrobiales bacterium]|nr:TetR/AcrR family transcriptional regulator C-terminal domain-containing protein [Acidimicrobiales bacterium]
MSEHADTARVQEDEPTAGVGIDLSQDELVVRTPLTRERIVAVALELIGHEGLAACNMRRLASDLGVAPMSIYYHVPSKSDLLEAVADRALADMQLPSRSLSWEDEVRVGAFEARRVARRYPELIQSMSDPSRPSVQRLTQRNLEVYRKAGFNGDQAWTAHRTVVQFTTGAVMTDLQHLRAAGFTAGTLSVPEDEWLASDTGEQLEREFDAGLSVIVAGLAALRAGTA